ncbi:hypothetical protein L0F63_004622 [Massospora cicadina]|nr:hypothetical protein L0F63_004622 [Massospora cicadina]
MAFSYGSEAGFQFGDAFQYTLTLLDLVRDLDELFTISVVDFFTLDGFSKVPEAWRRVVPPSCIDGVERAGGSVHL